jgi:hypothetical protein
MASPGAPDGAAQELAQWTQEQKHFMRQALEQVLPLHTRMPLQATGSSPVTNTMSV